MLRIIPNTPARTAVIPSLTSSPRSPRGQRRDAARRVSTGLHYRFITKFTSLIPFLYACVQHTVLRRGLLFIRFCVSSPVFLRNHTPKLPFRCAVNVTRMTPFCDFSILICKKHSDNCILSQKHLRRFLYDWIS